MATLFKRPAGKKAVYIITEKTDEGYVIRRLKIPIISILYNPTTKRGKLKSYHHSIDFQKLTIKSIDGTEYEYFPDHYHSSDEEIEAAVKKGIAWAKQNIKT